jgi:hypothetical protein
MDIADGTTEAEYANNFRKEQTKSEETANYLAWPDNPGFSFRNGRYVFYKC